MLNQVDNTKIQACVQALGRNVPVSIDSAKRGEVRKLLNGLGFETRNYINLGIPVLESIYNGLLNGSDSVCLAVEGATLECSNQALKRFQNAIGSPVQTLPVQAPVKSLPAMADIKPVASADKTAQVAKLIAELMSGSVQPLDESRVIELIKAHSNVVQMPPTQVVIIEGEKKTVIDGLHHCKLPLVIKALKTGANVMLVGPAGSGKTTLAHQAAQALGVDFYFNGAIASEYKLTGFIDVHGRLVSTAFRKAYESGGLYLFDEIDASMPDALLAFNAALANGHMDFPDGTVKRHESFYCVAAANTFGKGADRVYVGRNALDAASLNRFAMITMEYDETLEKALAGNDNWVQTVQSIRKAVNEHKIRHVVSPRASITGAKMLLAGIPEREIMDMLIWQGLDVDSVRKVKASAGM